MRAGAGLLFVLAFYSFMNAWLLDDFRPTRWFVMLFVTDMALRVLVPRPARQRPIQVPVDGRSMRPKPASRALTMACARLDAPNLSKIAETWLRTVFSDNPARAAI